MIMLEKVSENNDQNLQDSQGNTALHAAARQDGAQPHFRFQIISILLEIQVNPMMKNKAGKHAVQYLPRGELQAVTLLHQAMADQEGWCGLCVQVRHRIFICYKLLKYAFCSREIHKPVSWT